MGNAWNGFVKQQVKNVVQPMGAEANKVMGNGAHHVNNVIGNGAHHVNNVMLNGAQHAQNVMGNGAQLAHFLMKATAQEVYQGVDHAAVQGQSLMKTAEGSAITVVKQVGTEGKILLGTASNEICFCMDHAADQAQTLCTQGSYAAGQNFLVGFLSGFEKPLVKAVIGKLRAGTSPEVILNFIFRQGPSTKPSETLDALAAILDYYALSGYPSPVVFVLQLGVLHEAEKRGMLAPSLWSWMMKLLRLSEDRRQRLTGKLVHLPQDYDPTGAFRASAIDALVNTNDIVAMVRRIAQWGGAMVPLPPVTDVEIGKGLMIVPVLRDSHSIHTLGHARDARNGTVVHLWEKRGAGHDHVDNNVWKWSADGKIRLSSRPDIVFSKKSGPMDPLSDSEPVHLWKEHGRSDPSEKNQLFLFHDGYIALAADPTYVLTMAGDGGNGTKCHLAKRAPKSHPDHKKQLWKTVNL